MGTQYWPNPTLIGSNQDNGNWFTPGSSSLVLCVGTDDAGGDGAKIAGVTNAERQVLDGTYEAVMNYEAVKQEAQIRLYAKLLEQPELLLSNAEIASWFSSFAQSNISVFGNTFYALNHLSDTPSDTKESITNYAQGIGDLLSQINSLDGSLNTIKDESIKTQMLLQRDALSQDLSNMQNSLLVIYEDARTAQLENANQLYQAIDNIQPVNDAEAFLKSVLMIELTAFIAGEEPNSSSIQKLEDIAKKCRYQFGLAVVMARVTLKNTFDWNEYDNCPEANAERASAFAPNLGFSIYPNPVSDFIILTSEKQYKDGTIILHDWTGRHVQEWGLGQSATQRLALENDLLSGAYFLEIKVTGEKPTTLKVFIHRS